MPAAIQRRQILHDTPRRVRALGRHAPASFSEWARRVRPALQEVALRWCQDPVEAEDLVQETLVQGLRDFERHPPGPNVAGWLYGILRHRLLDRCRRRASAPEHTTLDEIADSYSAPASVTSEEEEATPTVQDILEAVGQLSAPMREVCQLVLVQERPYKEVAERLGIPVSTVGTRLSRARVGLRTMLLQRSRVLRERQEDLLERLSQGPHLFDAHSLRGKRADDRGTVPERYALRRTFCGLRPVSTALPSKPPRCNSRPLLGPPPPAARRIICAL